jgi:hypothetical protein
MAVSTGLRQAELLGLQRGANYGRRNWQPITQVKEAPQVVLKVMLWLHLGRSAFGYIKNSEADYGVYKRKVLPVKSTEVVLLLGLKYSQKSGTFLSNQSPVYCLPIVNGKGVSRATGHLDLLSLWLY